VPSYQGRTLFHQSGKLGRACCSGRALFHQSGKLSL
jgi:hypothetical protein